MFFRLGWLEPALTSESCTDRFVNGWSYSWEEGRQLASMNNGTTSDTYKYNADGMRTQKTVNGVTTKYYLEGDQIAWQTDGTNTIHYVYDTDGNADYILLNGSIYYYERNAQNDIIGLVDKGMELMKEQCSILVLN